MDNKRKISKDCHGCFSNNRNICNNMFYPESSQCPCNVCLIKVICNESCDEYNEFWRGENTTQHKKVRYPRWT